MKTIKKILSLIFLIILIIITLIGLNGYKMYKNAIENKPVIERINEIKNIENYTTLNDLPLYLKNAVIAVEDHRYYEHKGIDLISTTKAIFTNLKQKELVTGGSSITQQLAKNMYFSQEKTFSRKFAEIFIVSYLEENLSKDEILELYLNTIYYGNGYYGIGDAAIGYFNKKPQDLSINEATIIAGLPNAPSAYSLTEHKDLAKKRQQQVLESMVKYKYITEKEMNEILKED